MDKNDKTIPDAYQSLDRGGLSISPNSKKKKVGVIIGMVIIAAVIVFSAVFLAFSNGTDDDSGDFVVEKTKPNEVSGVERKELENSKNWLEEVRERKRLEKERLAQEERDRLKRENFIKQQELAYKEKTRVEVKRTGYTPAAPVPQVQRQQPVVSPRPEETGPTPEERKLTSDVMVLTDQSESGGLASTLQGLDAGSLYDTSFDAPVFSNGVASFRGKTGLDFLLQHGSSIPCALYSQIISDYQGIVTCRVVQDVYSANGKSLLIERGSLITGSQRVELEPGKNRVFTTWADIETPNGIAININSLGAGRLGASGNDAWVDNHFKERFGGAILLSFIEDGLQALADTASSNSDINFDNSTDTAESLAEQALESSINIKPTGYTQIGQRINIIVARDIDMSSVYAFE